MKIKHYVAMVLLLIPVFSWAELKDENLLQVLPSGYKIDFVKPQKT